MRIYITGSQSSGKTTIGRYISQKYNLHFINEVARTVLAEKELKLEESRINLDVIDDFQSTIFYKQLEEEKKYSDFVSDRSFDNLAYAAQHSRILSKLFYSEELKNYINSLKNNDAIIFFIRPHKSTLQEDGIRESPNWENSIAIDAMIKFMFECFELPYINISTPSMQERVRLVDSVINKFLITKDEKYFSPSKSKLDISQKEYQEELSKMMKECKENGYFGKFALSNKNITDFNNELNKKAAEYSKERD